MEIVDRICVSRGLRKQIAESRNRLYRVALSWCGEIMVADDLAQETLVIALQRVKQLRDPKCLNAWLYAILSNCWKQHLRRARDNVGLDDNHPSVEHSPETQSEEHEIVAQVRSAILKLPIGQRQTITLVDLVGFSYAETADILGIPTGTVMSRLHTARNGLQEVLARYRSQQPGQSYLRRVK